MSAETHFIGRPITVEFDTPPALSKTPHCPDRFVWDETPYTIIAKLSEWRDFARRGHSSRNMRPENLRRARQRGSWGVGRFFFRVQTAEGRTFDLYYDRAPGGSDQRAGGWVLYKEILDG